MWSLTFELIALAISNSHVVFCFCNLIIGILLVGSSKSTSNLDNVDTTDTRCSSKSTSNLDNVNIKDSAVTEVSDMEDEAHTFDDKEAVIEVSDMEDEPQNYAAHNFVDNEAVIEVGEVPCVKKAVNENKAPIDIREVPCVSEVTEVLSAMEDEAKGAEEEEDELKRRVEEFIAKINRGWKAEKLRSSVLLECY